MASFYWGENVCSLLFFIEKQKHTALFWHCNEAFVYQLYMVCKILDLHSQRLCPYEIKWEWKKISEHIYFQPYYFSILFILLGLNVSVCVVCVNYLPPCTVLTQASQAEILPQKTYKMIRIRCWTWWFVDPGEEWRVFAFRSIWPRVSRRSGGVSRNRQFPRSKHKRFRSRRICLFVCFCLFACLLLLFVCLFLS